MTKILLRRAALGVVCGLAMAPAPARAQPKTAPVKTAPARTPRTKTTAISAAAYRARLQKALDDLKTPPPGSVTKIVAGLDASYAVRRADGQIQGVSGNFWSNYGRELSSNPVVTPSQTKRAREVLKIQIRGLDEWTKTPAYQNADARKIVGGLAVSGQIRVAPLWWQTAITDAWGAVVRAWSAFTDWLNSLFPTARPLAKTGAPSDKWLWILFYVVVAAILALLLWFAFRAFGGNLGRRAAKRALEMQGEDAELLQLPPAELLSRAERFAAQGNYREALRHRFLSLLLDLDARGVWRYDARRTNWEHIAALSRGERNRALVAPLSDLTRRFDRVRYGGAACDDTHWRQFDADARAFETQAAPPKIAARETEMAR